MTGVDLLRDLSEFFQSFGDMAEGFSERAERVNELLARPTHARSCSSPRPSATPIDEAIYFRRRLREAELPFGGAVVNRMSPWRSRARRVTRPSSRRCSAKKLGRRWPATRGARGLAERDRGERRAAGRELRGEPLILVPQLEDDVHDIGGLLAMNEYLFAAEAVAAPGG